MTNYRRIFMPGATWFFTVNLARRDNQAMLVEHIEELRQAFRYVKQRRMFQIDAIVILPDHLHCIWTLPSGDSDYSTRWNLIKGHFSRHMVKGEAVSASRSNKRERGIWQRRLWVHWITDQNDFIRHIDYIHVNPLKHGLVKRVADWPHSSFHRYVKQCIYPLHWAGEMDNEFSAGEYLDRMG